MTITSEKIKTKFLQYTTHIGIPTTTIYYTYKYLTTYQNASIEQNMMYLGVITILTMSYTIIWTKT